MTHAGGANVVIVRAVSGWFPHAWVAVGILCLLFVLKDTKLFILTMFVRVWYKMIMMSRNAHKLGI